MGRTGTPGGAASAVSAVAAYNLAVELDGLGSFELQEANLLDECKWCFDTADSLAHKHLSATHPLTLAFYNPTVTDSSGRDGPARRVRLGRTVLGQKVDGSTYAVGWPHFTLMELKEVVVQVDKVVDFLIMVVVELVEVQGVEDHLVVVEEVVAPLMLYKMGQQS